MQAYHLSTLPYILVPHMQVNPFIGTDKSSNETVHRPDKPESDAGTTPPAALIAGDAMSLPYHGVRTHADQCLQTDGRGLL